MIGLRDKVTVRLEIDFELVRGELPRLRQDALDHPLERLIAMWGDQILRTDLMVLFRRLEKHGSKKNRQRKVDDLG